MSFFSFSDLIDYAFDIDSIIGTIFNSSDFIKGTPGDDIIIGTPFRDRIDGFAGNDTIIGLNGDDHLRGGVGADFLTGGFGLDTFIIKGDKNSGAYGPDSDLQFDDQGQVVFDLIFDFNDHKDVLVLEDMRVNGVDSVHYDFDTGDIILTDTVGGEITSSNIIAKLPAGLNISIHNQGNGNWTIS